MRKELHEYISEAIRTFGCEVLTEKRISNVLSDIGALTDFYWTDTVVYAANKNGLISKLIRKKNSIEKLSSEEVKKYAYILSSHNAIWLDVSEYVVSSIAYSLGLLSKPFVLNDFSKEYKFDNQFCGHWIFRYNKSRNKETDLVILNDGTAYTNEGKTKYTWNLLDPDTINLSLEKNTFYQGKFDSNGNLSGFAHNGILHWEWEAIRIYKGLDKQSLINGKWTILNDDPDLEDNIVTFMPNGALESSLYGKGSWKLSNNELELITANGFIKYIAQYHHKEIAGYATNRIGNRWKFKMIKYKENE